MNNRLIIALFIVFMLIVLYSSLRTVLGTQQGAVPSTPSALTPSQVVSATPVPSTPTFAPTLPPLQPPQFHVSGSGEAGDN